jgi:hypothetical protein
MNRIAISVLGWRAALGAFADHWYEYAAGG